MPWRGFAPSGWDAMNRVSTWRTSLAGGDRMSGPDVSRRGRRRCFLTRRMRFFRTPAPPLANGRKPETPDIQAQASGGPPYGCPGTRFLPLYVTFRGDFSVRGRPPTGDSKGWIGISMGCIGDSAPWISKRVACTGAPAARKRANRAGRRTAKGGRFNSLPHGAQGSGMRQEGGSRAARAGAYRP